MKNALKNIRIVLVNTSHPGNIGSAARAMKTMGLSDLTLVSPVKFPDPKANELASGADDILDNVRVVETLEEAISDATLVLATSARTREIPLDYRTPEAAAQMVAAEAQSSSVAIVFGREKAGLNNDELLRCQYHIVIPSNPDYSSLNLAAAVQVLTYQCRVALLERSDADLSQHRQEALATSDTIERFYEHFERVITAVDFYDPNQPKRLLQRVRRLFNRIHMEDGEVQMLRGILRNIEQRIP